MRMVALAIVCAALGCGKGLAELEPFRCAKDQSCPSGYLCLGDVCETLKTCDPVPLSSCSGARTRCTLLASPSDRLHLITQCVATTGGLPEGQSCDGPNSGFYNEPDSCFAGTLCYNVQFYGGAHDVLNHCRRLCHAEGDCNPPNTHCAMGFEGPQYSVLTGGTLGVCEPSCDFNGALCPAKQHCDTIPGMAVGTGILACRDDGTVAEGGSCASENCKAGLICVPGIAPFQNTPTCRVWCDNTSHLCAKGTCEIKSYRISSSTGFCH